jgi:hypothetical protein
LDGGNLGTDGKFTEAESQYSKVNFPSVPKFPPGYDIVIAELEVEQDYLRRAIRYLKK